MRTDSGEDVIVAQGTSSPFQVTSRSQLLHNARPRAAVDTLRNSHVHPIASADAPRGHSRYASTCRRDTAQAGETATENMTTRRAGTVIAWHSVPPLTKHLRYTRRGIRRRPVDRPGPDPDVPGAVERVVYDQTNVVRAAAASVRGGEAGRGVRVDQGESFAGAPIGGAALRSGGAGPHARRRGAGCRAACFPRGRRSQCSRRCWWRAHRTPTSPSSSRTACR